MGILRILLIGLVAGIIARLLAPGPNNPSGFILTAVLGIAGDASRLDRPGNRLVPPGSGRGIDRRDCWRRGRAVHLAPVCVGAGDTGRGAGPG